MIIDSLLQTDAYKFSMGQVVLHQFSSAQVEYEFKCRNNIKWTAAQVAKIRCEADCFSELKFTQDELNYLASIRYIKKDYVDFLKLYQPDISHVAIDLVDNKLKISIKGPWFLTIYWEVPLLAIVSEVYSQANDRKNFQIGKERFDEKLNWFNNHPFPLSDFGTRRRYCGMLHDYVVSKLAGNPNFVGTSNVYLAKKYNANPIGTMAHEFLQAGQALDVPLIDSQKRMLQSWVNEYRGDLGIALTDVIGIDAFLKDFDLYFAKLYDGLRHDSGDPEVWADKVIDHYKKLKIDSKTKSLVFSDGLNFEKAYALYEKYKNVSKPMFGIGGYLTNDTNLIPPNIVIKMTKCNGRPVAKLSDSVGKGMCNDIDYVFYLRKVFKI